MHVHRDIAIVGAGIGGLTAAIGLAHQGAKVDIFEKTPRLAESGAGIWMPPNAIRILDSLGTGTEIRNAGNAIECAELYDYRSGLLQALPASDSAGRTAVAILRQELQRILARCSSPATIRFGHELAGITQSPGYAQLEFSNGATHRASLVLAADGIQSAVRGLLFPEAKLKYSGQTSWRAVVEFDLPRSSVQKGFEIWAPGVRFGYSVVSSKRVYWYATADAPSGQAEDAQKASGRLRGMAALFPSPLPALVSATPGETIIRTDLWDLPGFKTWHSGCIVFLGDAAHAATPNLGQGGAQAIEDAWMLTRLFQDESDPAAVFSEFERKRMKRALSVVRDARRIGRIAHLGGIGRLIRNVGMRATPSWFTRDRMRMLFDGLAVGTG